MIKIIFQMFHHPPRIAKCHDGYICIKEFWGAIFGRPAQAQGRPHIQQLGAVFYFLFVLHSTFGGNRHYQEQLCAQPAELLLPSHTGNRWP